MFVDYQTNCNNTKARRKIVLTVSSSHPIGLSPALASDWKFYKKLNFSLIFHWSLMIKMIKMDITVKMVEITFIEEGWDGHDSETTSPHPFGPNLYHSFKSLHILHFQQIKSWFALETTPILWLLHHIQSMKYSTQLILSDLFRPDGIPGVTTTWSKATQMYSMYTKKKLMKAL